MNSDPSTAEQADCLDGYHQWYYSAAVHRKVRFMGVPCRKSVSDLWNYQEILFERRISLVVEFGTCLGGSALFFSSIMRNYATRWRVLTIDCKKRHLPDRVQSDPDIEVLIASTIHPHVSKRIGQLRAEYCGPIFVILDSDHKCSHVFEELSSLRSVTTKGDYVVVEDGNINGHPVLPAWGKGPYEAVLQYDDKYPGDYIHDKVRERKFGFSFAPNGYLIRS